MSEFKVIETQEQLDALIADRVARAEKKGREEEAAKYSDYEELKKRDEEYTAKIEALNKQLTDQAESAEKLKDLEAKVHDYETASVKTRVAHEEGLPYELAARLSGDDEDSIREDAKKLVNLVGNQKPTAPIGSTEPVQKGDSKESALREMLIEMKGD